MDICRPVYVKMCKSERAFHLLNTALAGVSSIYAYLLVLLKVMAGARLHRLLHPVCRSSGCISK